jgi:hypothetical protein
MIVDLMLMESKDHLNNFSQMMHLVYLAIILEVDIVVDLLLLLQTTIAWLDIYLLP